MISPRIGTDAEFAALRAALISAGYTEPAICARLGIQKITQFDLDRERRIPRTMMAPPDALDTLIRLFLEGDPVSAGDAQALPLDIFETLGLIDGDSAQISGTALLHPMRGLYIISDRPVPIGQPAGPPPDDFVYPAMIPNTDLFLDLIETGSCDAFLDLCAGSGIGALLAARDGATHAYAYDITERSTVFAEFNRRLNGLSNVTAAEGDLYEPAGALTFDRIVAHPPYVPVYRPQLIFDSGGQDGEQIVRRIIEGLPKYLRPGGRFYALTMGSDREQPFERRLREWLGPEEAAFDVAFVIRTTRTPRDWAAESVIRNRGAVADIANWRAFFENLRVRSLVYGLIMIQRRAENRPVFTVRRQTGPRTGTAEHRWLMDWETTWMKRDALSLLAERPSAAQGIELQVKHRLEAGNWTPYDFLLETEHPFNNELEAQGWTAYFFACADGSRTGTELLEMLKAEGALHPETPPVEFARLLATLISGGFLRI